MRQLLLCLPLVLALSDRPAHALCLGGQPDSSAVAEYVDAQFVMIARVEERRLVVDPSEDPEGYEGVLYRVHVEHLYKGQLPNGRQPSFLRLYTPNTSARFGMDLAGRYLLFVRSDEEGHWVNSCGNSVKLAKAEAVLRQLGLGLPGGTNLPLPFQGGFD